MTQNATPTDQTTYHALGKAVDLSSTTASNPHPTPLPCSVGGFDWFEITLWGDYHPTLAISLSDRLGPAQEAAKQNKAIESIVEVAGRNVQVLPITKPGYKGHYNYVINTEGIQYRLNLRNERDEESSAASIQVGSEMLMLYGAKNCWNQALQFLSQAASFEVENTRVHRVDLCVDLPNKSPGTLIEKMTNPEKFICRARQTVQYGELGKQPNSFRIGSDLQLRVYDKAKELRDKPNANKLATIKQHRWHGELCETATRVEYQLKREQLAAREIDTVSDLFNKLPRLVNYLTRDWSRVVLHHDGHNTERAKTDETWQEIRTLFREWAGKDTNSLERRNRPAPDVSRLTTQAIGCLESAIARMGKKPKTSAEAEAMAIEFIRGMFGDSIEKITSKRKEFEAKGSLDYEPQPYEEFQSSENAA